MNKGYLNLFLFIMNMKLLELLSDYNVSALEPRNSNYFIDIKVYILVLEPSNERRTIRVKFIV